MIPSYIVHFPAANLQLGVRPAFHARPCPSSYIWTVVIFELKKLSGREGAWGNPFNSTQRLDIRWIPHLQLAHNQLLMKHCLLYNNYLQPGSLSFIDSIDSVTCKVSLWIPSFQHPHETCKAQTLNSHGNSSPLAGGWGRGMFQKNKSVEPCLVEGVAILGMEALLLGATDVTLGTEKSSMNGKHEVLAIKCHENQALVVCCSNPL